MQLSEASFRLRMNLERPGARDAANKLVRVAPNALRAS